MLEDTGKIAMHKDLKDLLDKEKIAELATSKDAQEAFFGKNGLIKDLIKRPLETALKAEMVHHLENVSEESSAKNKRNGKSVKTIKSDSGEFEVDIPRDRAGDFEPQLVKKHQRRLAGLDQKILALYA